MSLIKIEDVAGLSKPLTRLIEVIAQGIGNVTTPYLIRKTAEARAHLDAITNPLYSDLKKKLLKNIDEIEHPATNGTPVP